VKLSVQFKSLNFFTKKSIDLNRDLNRTDLNQPTLATVCVMAVNQLGCNDLGLQKISPLLHVF